MRSGREHNTPDKAMWGFLITVRAQESTEEVFFRKTTKFVFFGYIRTGIHLIISTLFYFSTHRFRTVLPFLADLALGLSVLACTMLHLLYQGPEENEG